jgi:hypothetical protein
MLRGEEERAHWAGKSERALKLGWGEVRGSRGGAEPRRERVGWGGAGQRAKCRRAARFFSVFYFGSQLNVVPQIGQLPDAILGLAQIPQVADRRHLRDGREGEGNDYRKGRATIEHDDRESCVLCV